MKTDPKVALAAFFKRSRTRAKKTQGEFALLLGVHQAHLSKVESGAALPSGALVVRLSELAPNGPAVIRLWRAAKNLAAERRTAGELRAGGV